MKKHILQSEIWAEFQRTLGRTLVEGKGEKWSYVGIVEKDRFGTYVYVPYGPHVDTVDAIDDAIDDLKQKAAKLGAYVVMVEPTPPLTKEIMRSKGLKPGYHRQAHRTLHIDLTRSEDEIIADMNSTRRKQHRNYSKKGIEIMKDNSREALDEFYELLKLSSGEKHFYIRSKKFFETLFEQLVPTGNVSLYKAVREGSTEVIALIYDDEDTRYYAHVGRELGNNSLQASAPLISYMILDAKAAGKKIFDLYGISESDDKVDEKSGFTVFKKTFGGEIISFAGAWEIPLKPVNYAAKKTLSRLKKTLRR